MKDRRSAVLAVKALINLAVPVPAVKNLKAFISAPSAAYATAVLLPAFAYLYVLLKKSRYNRVFLRKTYLPSNKLMYSLAVCELPVLLLLHWLLATPYLGACHLLLAVVLFACARPGRDARRLRIASFDTKFRLGILARNIGEARGLRAGEVVKIMRKTSAGYVVRNSQGEEFELVADDIAEVIDIV